MFRCQEYMTPEQLIITEEFQNLIETEYALCAREIERIEKSYVWRSNRESIEEAEVDCANLQLTSVQNYWQKRLDCIIDFVEKKDFKLGRELAVKYLKKVRMFNE